MPSSSDEGGFAWYGDLPQGIECQLRRPATSRRELGYFLHRLPARTETLTDFSVDPVISLALDAAGTVEREMPGKKDRAAIRGDTLVITPAQTEFRWHWAGEPLSILDVYIPNELLRQTAAEITRREAAEVDLQPTLSWHEDSLVHLLRSILAAPSLQGHHAMLMREVMTQHLVTTLLCLNQDIARVHSCEESALHPVLRRRVEAYIEENLGRAISLQDMAEIARMSRYHFLRMFRAATGMTPHVYVTERRMQQACRLLADPKLSIGEIAAECGFDEPSYFSSRFKSRFGNTPRAWRRLLN